MSPEEKRKKSIFENKKKWIIKRDFFKYSGNNIMKKNPELFVNLDHFYDSPLNHKFRDEDKKQWIGNRNFYG